LFVVFFIGQDRFDQWEVGRCRMPGPASGVIRLSLNASTSSSGRYVGYYRRDADPDRRDVGT
jgi:hypothetical protein